MIVLPDALTVNRSTAIVSGGCTGHEFTVNTGQGLVAALSQACSTQFDSVIFAAVLPPRSECTRRNILFVISVSDNNETANLTYDIGAFHANITATISEQMEMEITDSTFHPLYQHQFHLNEQSSGTGDCHAGALYLKQAGTTTSTKLRDSVSAVLSALVHQ
jgi:hypothetical protein